ncbi:MAG: transglutaminase domain-containing protein [Phycisphaerales bacterium]|nr:MAG: transglutaminase domain-containing protein [Phycisphaerales bacterium]
MSPSTRHPVLRSLLLGAVFLALGLPALAADPPVLSFREERRWTLNFEVDVRHPSQRVYVDAEGFTRYTGVNNIRLNNAFVFAPVLESTGAHETHPDAMESELRNDRGVIDRSPTLLDGTPWLGRYARWQLGETETNFVRVTLRLPMTCRETVLDERRAVNIAWPAGDWPAELAECLRPQQFIDSDSPEVRALVDKWLDGNNPRNAAPMLVAKLITARTLEHFQPTGNGYETNSRGRIEGFTLNGASAAAKDQRGSTFDMVCLLVAAWRAAGIPARPVIGYDKRDSDREGFPVYRAWAEFALHDESDGRTEWIPVDIVRQRAFSSRAPRLDRAWDYFGNHEHLDYMLPIAFHFHPPVGVVAHGSPGLWGWMPSPRIPLVEQELRVFAFETPQRGGRRR